jgi:hypothetical protein
LSAMTVFICQLKTSTGVPTQPVPAAQNSTPVEAMDEVAPPASANATAQESADFLSRLGGISVPFG